MYRAVLAEDVGMIIRNVDVRFVHISEINEPWELLSVHI